MLIWVLTTITLTLPTSEKLNIYNLLRDWLQTVQWPQIVHLPYIAVSVSLLINLSLRFFYLRLLSLQVSRFTSTLRLQVARIPFSRYHSPFLGLCTLAPSYRWGSAPLAWSAVFAFFALSVCLQFSLLTIWPHFALSSVIFNIQIRNNDSTFTHNSPVTPRNALFFHYFPGATSHFSLFQIHTSHGAHTNTSILHATTWAESTQKVTRKKMHKFVFQYIKINKKIHEFSTKFFVRHSTVVKDIVSFETKFPRVR